MDLWGRDIPSRLPFPPIVCPEPLISLANVFLEIQLAVRGEARHQLRFPQGYLMALVRLPQMVDFAVKVDNLVHLRVF